MTKLGAVVRRCVQRRYGEISNPKKLKSEKIGTLLGCRKMTKYQ